MSAHVDYELKITGSAEALGEVAALLQGLCDEAEVDEDESDHDLMSSLAATEQHVQSMRECLKRQPTLAVDPNVRGALADLVKPLDRMSRLMSRLGNKVEPFCGQKAFCNSGVSPVLTRQPVMSSAIVAIGYEKVSRTLEVEFTSGGVYRYYDVPQLIVDGLLLASSKGQFMNYQIRNAFPCLNIG